jgi:putative oxidoreductase
MNSVLRRIVEDARYEGASTVCLRLALAAGFLTAVTDRFGVWGPAGAPNVAWGDFGHFLAYTATLNPHLPAAVIPALGWFVTAAEVGLAIALAVGFRTREVAFLAGVLLLLFALGMTVGTGVKSALNASVFPASAGAFLLAARERPRVASAGPDAARRQRNTRGSTTPSHVE